MPWDNHTVSMHGRSTGERREWTLIVCTSDTGILFVAMELVI